MPNKLNNIQYKRGILLFYSFFAHTLFLDFGKNANPKNACA